MHIQQQLAAATGGGPSLFRFSHIGIAHKSTMATQCVFTHLILQGAV